jgi:hypothetical protein
MSSDPASRAAHRLLCGRLAGVLFLVGSLAGIPVNQLLQPEVSDRVHVISAIGISLGRHLHADPVGTVCTGAGCRPSRRRGLRGRA